MNKNLFLSALLPALLVLGGCTHILTTSPVGQDETRLAACTGKDTMFAEIPFNEWPQKYHSTVASVVDAHEDNLKDIDTLKLECTADDYASTLKPTGALKELARTLPPWKESRALDKLSEMDLGPVLLEYLRLYECALLERRDSLSIEVLKDFAGSSSSKDTTAMPREDFNKTGNDQRRTIDQEIRIARPTLDRTLLLVGGEDRLRPLSMDIECLKRTSLDIRNIMGLVSQATACLPRVRDARGSLQDPKNP